MGWSWQAGSPVLGSGRSCAGHWLVTGAVWLFSYNSLVVFVVLLLPPSHGKKTARGVASLSFDIMLARGVIIGLTGTGLLMSRM
jgi:hypothetical protein